MNRTITLCIVFLLLLGGNFRSLGQGVDIIDSLQGAISKYSQLPEEQAGDTAVCHAYILWGEQVYLKNPDTALILWHLARKLAKENIDVNSKSVKITYLERYSTALNNIGYIYDDQGKIQKALEVYLECMKIKRELGNKKGVATALNNIGYIYKNLGDIATGLEYYHQSLKIREELEDKWSIANSLNNIGSIYDDQGDVDKAKEYYNKSLNLNREIEDVSGIALGLSNLGLLYKNLGDIPKALKYLFESLELRESIDYRYGIAVSLNNIGASYSAQGDLDKALEYFYKCMKIQEEIGDKNGEAYTLSYMGNIYLKKNDVPWAKNIALNMLSLSDELGNPRLISQAALLLKNIATVENNHRVALEMYELHINMKDSINNETTQKATVRQQTRYEFEKEQLVSEQKEKESARMLVQENSRRNNLQYSVVLICLMIVGVLITFIGRLPISERFAEGLIFFSFLIFFEFILVLADPYIDDWSSGAPGIKLLFNAGIAALVFPLHSFFEEGLKGRLEKLR